VIVIFSTNFPFSMSSKRATVEKFNQRDITAELISTMSLCLVFEENGGWLFKPSLHAD